ncbi:unnamed protein product [Linum trigynum]|uniref:Uncharacterized protein n=1 Tax=Linum trigynum TaxID=586398 RepID=A0AAV2EJL9_9ROSI
MPSKNKLAQIGAYWTYHPWRIGSIDFIIGGEKARPDSVICSLYNRKKMAFRKNAEISDGTPMESGKNGPGINLPKSALNGLNHH